MFLWRSSKDSAHDLVENELELKEEWTHSSAARIFKPQINVNIALCLLIGEAIREWGKGLRSYLIICFEC